MSEETPQFSTQEVEEEAPKRKPRKHTPSSHTRTTTAARKNSESNIANQLSTIYKDDRGNMPDMKNIKIKTGHSFIKSLIGLLILGGFLSAAAWAGFFLLPATNKMNDAQITLSLDGPKNLALGETDTYKITYRNDQNIELKNVSLSVYYPEGFSFTESSLPPRNGSHTEWSLGNIGAKQTGELTITGKIFGSLDKESSWRVFLNYQPENFNSPLQKMVTFDTKVIQSPVTIAVSGPEKAAIGNDVEYTFTINTKEGLEGKQLKLVPTWPANFHPTTSTPLMKKDSWVINIPPANSTSTASATQAPGTLTFKAKGKFSDSTDTKTEVKATLYLDGENEQEFDVAETSLSTELVKNSLNISLAVNGAMDRLVSKPGDTLNISLDTKNTSSETLSKANVKLILEAPSTQNQSALAWSDIKDKYDGDIKGEQLSSSLRRGQIIWDSSKVPALKEMKTNDEVTIDLTLPVKEADKYKWEDSKEFKVTGTAEISYSDVNGQTKTITSNPVIIVLNSDLSFENRDEVKQVDSKDVHHVSWVLTNNAHPLKNLNVTADLYGDVTFTNPTEVPAGEVKYDTKVKRISWVIKEMPQGVDVLALPMDITLNQKNPTQNTLMSKVKITANDTVTGETIELTGDEIALN